MTHLSQRDKRKIEEIVKRILKRAYKRIDDDMFRAFVFTEPRSHLDSLTLKLPKDLL